MNPNCPSCWGTGTIPDPVPWREEGKDPRSAGRIFSRRCWECRGTGEERPVALVQRIASTIDIGELILVCLIAGALTIGLAFCVLAALLSRGAP